MMSMAKSRLSPEHQDQHSLVPGGTLAILWYHLLAPRHPGLRLSTVGTEIDAHLPERSQRTCYPGGTIKNLPEDLRYAAFLPGNGDYCLKPQ